MRSRRFKLEVPAGRYRLFAATIPFRGKPGVDVSAGNVRVRAGKRKTQRVWLRKRRTKLPTVPGFPALPRASAAFVTVKHPAVWIKHFTVSGPSEYDVLRKGLADMLITDVLTALGPACGGVIVEREKLAFILGEQLLQQGPQFDPASRVQPGKIIAHNREVTGSLNIRGGTATLAAVVTNVATGATRSVTRSGPADRPFELEQSIVEEVTRLICGDSPPAAYVGQASGSTSGSSGSSSQTLSWNGNVRLRHTGDVIGAVGSDPEGEYALYAPESGGIHVILDGVDGDCSYHGETDVTIAPAAEISRVQQGIGAPSYSLQAKFPVDTPPLPYTITGPDHCRGGGSGLFPIFGRVFLNTLVTQRSSSSQLAGTVTAPLLTKWSWSLAPQSS